MNLDDDGDSDSERWLVNALNEPNSKTFKIRKSRAKVVNKCKSNCDSFSRKARAIDDDESDPEFWPSVALGMGRKYNDEEEEEDEEALFRTDRYWYVTLHKDLTKFIDNLAGIMPPRTEPGTGNPYVIKSSTTLIDEINAMDEHIKRELRDRLNKMGFAYDETNPYDNVIKYMRYKEVTDPDEIVLWLGKTDYNYNSGGHAKQKRLLMKLKKKYGGGKKTRKAKAKANANANANAKAKLRKMKQKSRKGRRHAFRK